MTEETEAIWKTIEDLAAALSQAQAFNRAHSSILMEIVRDIARSQPDPQKYISGMYERISARADLRSTRAFRQNSDILEQAMASETPRIEKVSVISPSTLRVKWRSRAAPDEVDLTGWIATGGEALAALAGRDVFKRAAAGNYGTAVLWDGGDLAIDAAHLLMLAIEQKEFSEDDARRWQKRIGLSNNEVADLLDISLSTWNAYKSGSSTIPQVIALACRAMLRDPVIMQAHYRPRKTGRPAA